MKSKQQGSIIPLLIVIIAILVIGGIYMYSQKGKMSPQDTTVNVTASTTPAGTTDQNTETLPEVSVAGMNKYTDQSFGYSFWYPSNWQVTVGTVINPNVYPGGTVVRQLNISEKSADGSAGARHVTIEEFSSPTYSITDSTGVGACPVCVPTHYYYNLSQHTWMVEYPEGTSSGASGSSTPADISNNTMGGLHMLAGSHRFGGNTIIPLSAKNFLIVTTDGELSTGSSDPKALAKTVVATDPSVGTPVSTSQQEAIIKAEQAAYKEF